MGKRNRAPDDEEAPPRRRRAGGVEPPPTGGGGAPPGERRGPDGRRLMSTQEAIEHTMNTGDVLEQHDFPDLESWAEYKHSIPQEFMQRRRLGAYMRDREILNRGSYGTARTAADLGIADEKEMGRSRYRRMGMHNLDSAYSYDWANGVKYNIATTDLEKHGKPVPIDPSEWYEKKMIDQFGATPEGYLARLRSEQAGRMSQWATANAAKDPELMAGGGGYSSKLHRDPATGRLRAYNDAKDEWVYFDEFGNVEGNPDLHYDDGSWGQATGVKANRPVGGTGPGATAAATGDYARIVSRRDADYGGWGGAYGPQGTPGTTGTAPAVPTPTPPPSTAPAAAASTWGASPTPSAPTQKPRMVGGMVAPAALPTAVTPGGPAAQIDPMTRPGIPRQTRGGRMAPPPRRQARGFVY